MKDIFFIKFIVNFSVTVKYLLKAILQRGLTSAPKQNLFCRKVFQFYSNQGSFYCEVAWDFWPGKSWLSVELKGYFALKQRCLTNWGVTELSAQSGRWHFLILCRKCTVQGAQNVLQFNCGQFLWDLIHKNSQISNKYNNYFHPV